MDNKIFKRIVAAAAGVTMLGTCAFATGLTTASYEDGTLSFDYTVAEGATKVTYLAYAATVAGENDTTFTTVDGTNYVLGNIVAVNQLDEIPETKSEAVAISADLLGEATNIVLMSGDDLGSDVALAAVATTTVPDAPTYEYNVALQNVTYNGTAATVVRITGLDPAAVSVTVDETVAKYYVNTTSSANVIVACIAGTYTDTAAVKELVSIAEGTTEKIIFGDATGDGTTPVEADITELARCIAGFERTKPTYKKFQLPTDLMNLLVLDVTGDGSVNESDITELARSIAGFERTKPTYKKFSLDTMSCYTK